MPDLIIVRHGQSAWNLENRFTGEVDVDLTDQGVTEAKAAGLKLKGFQFSCAYTSVLKRAIRTLEIILQQINDPQIAVLHNAALNERNYGDLQGLNKAETEKKFGPRQVLIWRRSFDVAPPGGESLKDTFERVIPYYSREIVPALRDGKNVLIVAHGNSLRALMMFLENITPEDIAEINIPTGVPRHYQFDNLLNLKGVSYLG